MPFALPWAFAPIMLAVSATRAKSKADRARRDAAEERSCFRGAFLGNASVITAVTVLVFTVPLFAGGAAAGAVVAVIAGVLTLNRNRRGLTAAAVLWAFLPVWIGYAVFIAKRWSALTWPPEGPRKRDA